MSKKDCLYCFVNFCLYAVSAVIVTSVIWIVTSELIQAFGKVNMAAVVVTAVLAICHYIIKDLKKESARYRVLPEDRRKEG